MINSLSSNLPSMPSPKQKWSHSTCSQQELNDALKDPFITAIEADILMGLEISNQQTESTPLLQHNHVKKQMNEIQNTTTIDNSNNNNNSDTVVPIMAHPPEKTSDLTVRNFLLQASIPMHVTNTKTFTQTATQTKRRMLTKHLKLDFKEMETVKPTLDTIDNIGISLEPPQIPPKESGSNSEKTIEGKCIFLNADILPGPAMRNEIPRMEAYTFLKICLGEMKSNQYKEFIFSLGWVTDPRSFGGYTDTDILAMLKIIEEHDLTSKCGGIVFAVNARVLVQDCKPFSKLLSSTKSSQLLVWTATGEPPISGRKIGIIQRYFDKEGFIDRVGFDCNVATSPINGFLYDLVVYIAAFIFYAKKWLA